MSDNVNHRKTLHERFWEKVGPKVEGACWLWRGSRHPRTGHGQISNGRGNVLKAHRLSYEWFHGGIPEGLFVCHSCGNAECVNPEHLYAGTAKDNWRDAQNHGTAFKFENLSGEKCRASKLSAAQVDEIRDRLAIGGESLSQIAKDYEVTKQAVWRIKHEKTWRG